VAFDEVTWLTAKWTKIFVIACVHFIVKSLSESESKCANTLYVMFVDSRNTCIINTVL
jgi:hypothetical protein